MSKQTRKAPTTDTRCGTNAGYTAHTRRGETPCSTCRQARTLYESRRREARQGSTPAPASHTTSPTTTDVPPPPPGLARRGKAFWNETLEEYALTPANRELLAEACRTLDRLERLNGAIKSKRKLFLELEETDEMAGDMPTFNVVVNGAVSAADKLQTTFRATIKQLGLCETHPRAAEQPEHSMSNVVSMFQDAKNRKAGP